MKTRLLGAVLMSSALLLQVGYASTKIEDGLTNTQAFDVYFGSPTILKADSGIQLVMEEGEDLDKGSLDIQVGNMYPGAGFEFETTIYNKGNTDARVVDIEMAVDKEDEQARLDYSTELMDMLVGYDESGKAYPTLEAYTTYLVEAYENKVIKQGETLPIRFSMAMNEEEVGRQNQEVAFSINLQFAQVQTGGGSGGTDTPETDTPDPDTTPEETPEGEVPGVDIPDEGIPGGGTGTTPEGEVPGVDIPDEGIPGGGTGTTPEGEVPEVDMPDESIPGGPTLPQTGGLTPYMVYGTGMFMMLVGFLCYRKKEIKKG